MTILTIAIISIIAWQLINTLVFIILDEEVAIQFSFGVWGVLFTIISFCYRNISLIIDKVKYDYYQFYDKNEKIILTGFMTKKVAKQFYQNPSESFSIKLRLSGKDFKSKPCKSEVLTQERINDLFSKKVLTN